MSYVTSPPPVLLAHPNRPKGQLQGRAKFRQPGGTNGSGGGDPMGSRLLFKTQGGSGRDPKKGVKKFSQKGVENILGL